MSPIIGECLQTGIHGPYIFASFFLSALILIGMVGWIVWQKRALKHEVLSRQARQVRRDEAEKLERAL
jgi:heme exporter protein CcmD